MLYDSIAEAEEQETRTKAAALFETISRAKITANKNLFNKVKSSDYASIAEVKSNKVKVLLIDYEDSFVHTLANYIRQTGATVTTLRHGFAESVLDEEDPDLVVLSPGPGRPHDFGVPDTVQACVRRQLPIFGVCLGLQGIVEAFGGELGVLDYPQHGKSSRIFVTDQNSGTFQGLPESFEVGRYHSLFALPQKLPSELKVTAISDDDVIMGIEHQTLPIAAVQFHPESIMSLAGEVGLAIIANVVCTFAKNRPQQSQTLNGVVFSNS